MWQNNSKSDILIYYYLYAQIISNNSFIYYTSWASCIQKSFINIFLLYRTRLAYIRHYFKSYSLEGYKMRTFKSPWHDNQYMFFSVRVQHHKTNEISWSTIKCGNTALCRTWLKANNFVSTICVGSISIIWLEYTAMQLRYPRATVCYLLQNIEVDGNGTNYRFQTFGIIVHVKARSCVRVCSVFKSPVWLD